MKTLSTRVRATLVLATAGATLVATTTFAAAHHDGDATTLHACVAKGDGQLRLLSSGETCRSSEQAVQWSVGGSDAAAVEELRAALAEPDDSVNDSDGRVHWTNVDGVPQPVLDASGDLSAYVNSLAAPRSADGPDLVHWTNLGGVPGGLADGVHPDDVLGQLLARHLAPDSVGSTQVEDGAIGAAELAPGAVTSEKIADGTVESRDLGPRSVTADKLGLAAAVFTALDMATLPLLAAPQAAPDSLVALTLDVPARVAVGANLQLSCMCSNPGDAVSVTYQLVRVTDPGAVTPTLTAVSPSYVAVLRNGDNTVPVSLSALDTAGAGDHAYKVHFVVEQTGSTTSTVTPSNVVVHAHAVGPA